MTVDTRGSVAAWLVIICGGAWLLVVDAVARRARGS